MAFIKIASKTVESSRAGATRPKAFFNSATTMKYNSNIVKHPFYFEQGFLFKDEPYMRYDESVSSIVEKHGWNAFSLQPEDVLGKIILEFYANVNLQDSPFFHARVPLIAEEDITPNKSGLNKTIFAQIQDADVAWATQHSHATTSFATNTPTTAPPVSLSSLEQQIVHSLKQLHASKEPAQAFAKAPIQPTTKVPTQIVAEEPKKMTSLNAKKEEEGEKDDTTTTKEKKPVPPSPPAPVSTQGRDIDCLIDELTETSKEREEMTSKKGKWWYKVSTQKSTRRANCSIYMLA
ncbi:hypothetical protein J1N35_013855 [Gossypium stocksii]|uniref:Uncharacterized protein n=1 Tax=Gossypium stocksii TaxID=47602 RepID=A0A9D4A8R9_9ROSI|nr:hypothetical protein J1N35_013855 [Gossypium stocksii]